VEFVVSIPLVMGIVAVLIATAGILSRVAPHTTLTPEAIQRAAAAPTLSFVIFFVCIATFIAPLCEEVFFHGFLQSALRMRMPVVVAALVQSAVFAIGHTFGMLHGVAVFILGLILTTACEWRKSLLTSIFVHAGNNLVASLGFVALVILNSNTPVLGIVGHDHPQGCLVDAVLPQSGASQAGIAVGDVVTKLNGEPVTGFLPCATCCAAIAQVKR
jgi:membrane protease YdiL (CAAX protease family)